jgi:ankyrin repeat protein
LETLLKHKNETTLEAADKTKQTPLLAAATLGHNHVFDILLKAGAREH